MPVNDLIDDIIAKRKSLLGSKIKRYPASNFRASNITDCDRQMVYSVLDWKEQTLYDEGLQAIFDAGNDEELRVKKQLLDIGYEVIEAQSPFEVKNRQSEVICRGHIDGKIRHNGQSYPCEIKSMNGNIFNQINCLEDFQKKPIHRKYLRQMQMYLFGNNLEEGFFLMSDFRSWKLLPVYLDMGECEWILKRLEKNWEHVKAKTYPDRIDYNEKICSKCNWAHVCMTDIVNKGIEMIDNEELEAKLDRRKELEPLVDEYEDIDEEVKKPFKDNEKAVEMLIGAHWRATSIKQSGGVKLDKKALPDDLKEKLKEYETEGKPKTVVKFFDLNDIKPEVK